jgi:hypothetical protein
MISTHYSASACEKIKRCDEVATLWNAPRQASDYPNTAVFPMNPPNITRHALRATRKSISLRRTKSIGSAAPRRKGADEEMRHAGLSDTTIASGDVRYSASAL